MLTGLLFAIEKAVDHPARLVATLPFAGATLIEHQARQLIAVGAGQIVVVADRHTPELQGALHRIARRGVAVDLPQGPVEAAAAVHPLAHLVMLADGLVTTDAVVRLVCGDGGDALLTIAAEDAPAGWERIGGGCAWAGLARIVPERLTDLARLPADYAPQSTLLRLAEAAGAARLPLPIEALDDGHGIDRAGPALADRGRRIVAAAVSTGRGWFDRLVAGPIVRLALPPLVDRGIDTGGVGGVAALLLVVGAAALLTDRFASGMLLGLIALLVCRLGAAVAELRDERGWRHWFSIGGAGTAAVAALLLGWRCSILHADTGAIMLAAASIVATLLVERTGAAPGRWWGGPGAGIAIVTAATLLGWPVAGLGLAALHATIMLALAIEGRSGEV